MSLKSLISGTALLLALPAQAFAQVSPSNTDIEEDVISVTGQHLYSDRVNALKSPTPIIDVPQSGPESVSR